MLRKACFCLFFYFIIQNAFSQTFQTDPATRDVTGDVMLATYSISHTLGKHNQNSMYVNIKANLQSIDKIIYRGKVFYGKDLPSDIMEELKRNVRLSQIHYEIYNGSSLLKSSTMSSMHGSSAANSRNFTWVDLLNVKFQGDINDKMATEKAAWDRGEAMLQSGSLRVKIVKLGQASSFYSPTIIKFFNGNKEKTNPSSGASSLTENTSSGSTLTIGTTNDTSTSTSQESTSANNTRNQSSSSGNTTTTNSKSNEQLEQERVARQLAAMEKQRIANEELQSAVTTGITTFGNQIAQSIEEKYAREERNAIRREENANKGSALLRIYESDALKGNEEAIQQAMEGYRLLGNEEDRRVFMETMLAKHNSTAARIGLTSYYTNKMNFYKSQSNSHLGLGVFTLAASGLAAYGLSYLADEINIYEEPERESEYDMYTYGTAGVLIVGVVGSLIHFSKVGYKNDPEYIKAKSGLEGVQNKYSVSFAPMIDLRNNAQGVALRINF